MESVKRRGQREENLVLREAGTGARDGWKSVRNVLPCIIGVTKSKCTHSTIGRFAQNLNRYICKEKTT
jgi:hypothetical protein